MKKFFKFIVKVISVSFRLALALGLICLAMNAAILIKSNSNIVDKSALNGTTADCIVVLGCGVYSDGTLSPMLKERVDTAIELYNMGISDKILMTGDHVDDSYNEVIPMKNYAIENGVPSDDIYVDHYGINTYDSLYRAKSIFGLKKIIVVTQKYHLYRSVYCAEYLGMSVKGVVCDTQVYSNQIFREIREFASRTKVFIYGFIQPEAEYMGEPFDMTQSGNATNERVALSE